MTFPRLPADEPKTVAEHVALLPSGLRAFVEREVRAGNIVGEAGSGFPAAPIGYWVKLQRPFLTLDASLPEGVIHVARREWRNPGECTDAPRHFFVLSGPLPEPPPKPVPSPPPPLPPRSEKVRPPLDKPPMAPAFDWREQAERWDFDLRVSAAIVRHLGLMWSKEIEAAIIADIGEEGLKRLHEIDAFANRAELWTQTPSDRAYKQVQNELKEKFPFLSPDAVQRLSTRAAWSWR